MQVYLDTSFPPEVRNDLKLVAREVLTVVCARMGDEPPEPKPVVCHVRRSGPLTSVTNDPTLAVPVYRVGLTVTTRDYCRMAYQLGHELGHVMIGPQRSNGPIEVIAVALSLQVLDDMAERWARTPPYKEWTSFAGTFRRYRAEVERAALERLPPKVRTLAQTKRWGEINEYLRGRQEDLLQNVEARDLQHLAAMSLLGRNGTLDFRQFWGLASLTDPPPWQDRRYRSDLPLDPRRLPRVLRSICMT